MTLIDGDSGEVVARVDVGRGVARSGVHPARHGRLRGRRRHGLGRAGRSPHVRRRPAGEDARAPLGAGVGLRQRPRGVHARRAAGPRGRRRSRRHVPHGRPGPVAGRAGGVQRGRRRGPAVAARGVQRRPGVVRRRPAARPARSPWTPRGRRAGAGGRLAGGGRTRSPHRARPGPRRPPGAEVCLDVAPGDDTVRFGGSASVRGSTSSRPSRACCRSATSTPALARTWPCRCSPAATTWETRSSRRAGCSCPTSRTARWPSSTSRTAAWS